MSEPKCPVCDKPCVRVYDSMSMDFHYEAKFIHADGTACNAEDKPRLLDKVEKIRLELLRLADEDSR